MEPVVIRTERLVLSVPTLDDVDAITASCQDELLRDTLASLPWPYTRADAELFVSIIAAQGWTTDQACSFGIRESEGGPHIGSISWRRERGDVGFWLSAPHRGKGYLTEALIGLCDWVFAELGETRIGWEALVGNVASARVARAAGFRYTGVAPAELRFRDGSYPPAWHAVLEVADRTPAKPGWPL